MATAERPDCLQLSRDVTRYMFGELPEADKYFIETHLADCPPCSKRVTFARKFTALAKEQFTRADLPDEPCPETSVIVALEADELDVETARHVRAHLLFCKLCREEYLLLRRLSNEQFEEKAVAVPDIHIKMGDFIFQPAEGGIKSLGNFGSGRIMKPITARILGKTEAPSRSVRIEDTIKHAESNATSTIRILVEVDPERSGVTMQLETSPPRSDWTASLVGPDGNDLARAPLVAEKTILGSDLPYDSYAVNIWKGDTALASYTVEIRSA